MLRLTTLLKLKGTILEKYSTARVLAKLTNIFILFNYLSSISFLRARQCSCVCELFKANASTPHTRNFLQTP